MNTQDTQAIFNAIQSNQATISQRNQRIAELLRVNFQLVAALKSVRQNIDVSTINKRSTAKWESIIDQIDAALNANKEVCAK